MNKEFEKIIEELEKLDVKAIKRYKGGTFGDYEGSDFYIKKSDAIEIVKQEAERECVHYKRMTQADRIRAFSDAELADFLADSEIFSPCKNCDFHFVDVCKAPYDWICTKGYAAALIQKWLQSEVEV